MIKSKVLGIFLLTFLYIQDVALKTTLVHMENAKHNHKEGVVCPDCAKGGSDGALDLESLLHGDNSGQHIHDEKPRIESSRSDNKETRTGPDLESVLHGSSAGSHIHHQNPVAVESKHNAEDTGPDLEAILHGGVGGAHVHDAAPQVKQENDNEALRDSGPDLEAILHGPGSDGGHVHDAKPKQDEYLDDVGPDLEAILHGGQDGGHVHEHNPDIQLTEKEYQLAAAFPDLEAILHGGDAHAHSDEAKPTKNTASPMGRFAFASDPEAMLHGGDAHAHSHDDKKLTDGSMAESAPFGASDLEAMLHGDDGHAHDQPKAERAPGAMDPETLLHGGGVTPHIHTFRQAVTGSRPLSTDKDPDDDGSINARDVTIGKLRFEDVEDYRLWKSDRKKDSGRSGWGWGFSYISDTLLHDLQTVKQRYLDKLWGERHEDTTDKDQDTKNLHDEP